MKGSFRRRQTGAASVEAAKPRSSAPAKNHKPSNKRSIPGRIHDEENDARRRIGRLDVLCGFGRISPGQGETCDWPTRQLGHLGVGNRPARRHLQKHGLELEIVYTQGAGETQQAVISGSVDLGIAAGVMGVLSAYSKGAPVRVIGAETTGAKDLYWYVK